MSPDIITQLIIDYRYWILFPLACFEGPIISFIIGTFVALGYFNPLYAFGVLVLGDLIPDVAYYSLGRYGEKGTILKKYLSKIGITEGHYEVVRNLWRTHPGKTMFFSKLAYGLSTPFLISAGFLGMPFNAFVTYTLPVTFFQFGLLMLLGYFFGNSYYQAITQSFTGVGICIAAAALVGIAYFFFTRFMRDRLLASEKSLTSKE